VVRRRRECTRCQFRYTTYERKDWKQLRVKKSDGTTEPYDSQKIETGIRLAAEKRPISSEEISVLTDEITSELKTRDEQVIDSDTIGATVANRLQAIDKVAFVRFVSVYKNYSDPEEFRDVLDSILLDETQSEMEEQTPQLIDTEVDD
jgi:transcriptional repressor NrdR